MGHGSQGQQPSHTRWEPQELCALHWGAGMGSEGRMSFCGAGWDLLPAGWFCSPRRWHLVGSLLRSPMDHLQRPEHPSPEAGPPSAVPQRAQEGLGTAAEAGWPSLGSCNGRGLRAECERQEPPGVGGQRGPHGPGGAKPLRDAPLRAQAKCWRWGVDLGSHGGSGSCVGKARAWSAPHIP